MTLLNGRKKNRLETPDRQKLLNAYNKYLPVYRHSMAGILKKIKNLMVKNDINATIKQRIKSFNSFFDKLVLQNNSGAVLKITDIIGIRIICPFLEDLSTVEKLISENFDIIEIEHKATNYSIREFGYDSIHILIAINDDNTHQMPHTKKVCEIQLRSILQEAWAEIEHELIYKANVSVLSDPVKRKLASLNATLTLSDVIFQEIRDYQNQVTAKRQRRLEAVFDKMHSENKASVVEKNNELAVDLDPVSLNHIVKPTNHLEKMMFEALESHGKGDYRHSIKLYTLILNEKPAAYVQSIILNHRGMAHFVLSEYKKAIKDFTRSIACSAENFRALNNRGMAYRMLQMHTEALEDFNSSIELNAFQSDGYYSRALTLYDINDFVRALDDCEKVLRIKPDFKPAEKLKGIIHKKLMSM